MELLGRLRLEPLFMVRSQTLRCSGNESTMEEKEERRFIRLPTDSVSLCAESLGIHPSHDVTGAIAADVSFRIRQLTDTASQFMRHAKRKRLMVEDIDKALKWSRVEPLYGHGTSEPPSFHTLHESGLFSLQDHDVKLADVALSSPLDSYPLPHPPTVNATWLSVEGVSMATESEDAQVGALCVELKKNANESEQRYLSLLMEAISGENEDLRRVALTNVQTNASIANILPDLVQYLQETLGCWMQFTPTQLLTVLKLLQAICKNTQLFLDPYAPGLFSPTKSIILNPSYLQVGENFDHWCVRQMAAVCLAEIVRRCGSPLNDYIPDLYSSFKQLLSQSEVSLPVLYGVLLTLCHMGAKSIGEVLFPWLDPVAGYVQSLLESVALSEGALKVYEILLVSAELLLTSDTHLQLKPEHLPPHPSIPEHLSRTGMVGDSFFGPTMAMEVDGGGMIRGGDIPSLYDYLSDIFGERLSLRLAGHQEFRTPALNERKASPELQSGSKTAGKPLAPPRDDNLLRFLSQEGFKPATVQAHQKVPSVRPRSHRGRRLYNFGVAKTVLPVHANVLQKRPRTKPTLSRTDVASLKGSCPNYRGNVAKTQRGRTLVCDVSSSWL